MINFGLIETIKIIGGKSVLLELHIERLKTSLNKLDIQISENEITDKVEELVHLEQSKNKITDYRLRLEVTKLVNKNEIQWQSSSMLLPSDVQQTLSITIYRQQLKKINSFCNLKTTERTIYHQAQEFANKNNFDTAVVLNENFTIADAPIFNLFMIKGNKIFTPPLSDAPVSGVFRAFLLHQNFNIQEQSITLKMLLDAEEIFLTNAVRGIVEVNKIEEKKLQHIHTKKLKAIIDTSINY